jgi:site-specific DNA recombinase
LYRLLHHIHYGLLKSLFYLSKSQWEHGSEKGNLFNPKAEWITVAGAHEPIISQDLFDKVQGQFKTWKMRVGGVLRRPYLLTGIAICGRCGYKLTGRPSHNSRGYGSRIYDCSGYARIGTSACQSLHLPTEQLDSIVLGSVRERLRERSFQDEVKETMAIVYEEQFGSGAERRVDELENQIAEVEREIERFVNAVRGGSFSPALAKALQDVEDRQVDLRSQLKNEQAKLGAQTSPQMLIGRILGLADDFDRMWDRCATPEGRKEFIQAFVHQVNIQREGPRMDADCWHYKIPAIKMARDPNYGIPSQLKISCVTDKFHTVDLRGHD